MSNIDFDKYRILLVNSYFQSRNAKITRFWNRATTNAKDIFHGIRTRKEFFSKIIRDFQTEFGEDFIEYLAGGELIGGITNILPIYENKMGVMERSGHIIHKKSGYHLTPDILSEYLINDVFFDNTFLKHNIEELAKADNGVHILDILNSLLKVKDDREIYREATEKLLEMLNCLESDNEQKKRRIRAGIVVYYGFGNLNLVTAAIGEFWTDYGILDDGIDLQALGIFLGDISKLYEARICMERANEIFKNNGDKIGIATSLHNLGIILHLQGNYEEAMNKYNQSLKIDEELGERHRISMSLRFLGRIEYDKGNYDDAVKLYNQSLMIAEKLGDQSGIAKLLGELGIVLLHQGNYDEAIKLYNQSLMIAEKLGDQSGIAGTLYELGKVYLIQDNYGESIEVQKRSLKIKELLGDKYGIAHSLHALGVTHEVKKEYTFALLNYLEASSIYKELNSPYSKDVSKLITDLRDKMGNEQFNKACKEFGYVPPDNI
ncbi:photosystem I assembly protein Ycf3 [Methanosarcina barkeri str. Wiesmoor]|uniref:Photosystem I assembly protein Ycf3 n=2 Tax=Methanosarcina barkeri TaxID=2208 RepID=A0A0E3QGZ4_METBA|nr:tetratricopeptide repeat protein [Methanosarcina barkeri]AKB49839.1 photosystem I assembly protein Ycf3 [Methanosarcina barkeri str. Wiesmoor]